MKKQPTIIRYNALNSRLDKGKSQKAPALSMQERGAFRLNRSLMDLMGVKIGESIELLHDTSASEWYITKGGENGLVIRHQKNGGSQFASVILAKLMAEAADAPSGRFLVATKSVEVDGSEAWAVLISSAA
jgi:hypothetical protein